MQGYLKPEDGTHQPAGDNSAPIECFRCGVCCTHYRPRVSHEEIERIARELGMPAEGFILEFVRDVPELGTNLLDSSEDQCPFLSRDKRSCNIYPVRPQACRDWLASLSRPECREGLTTLREAGEILLPRRLHSSRRDIEKLSSTLADNGRD